jgi:hypothetical protein
MRWGFAAGCKRQDLQDSPSLSLLRPYSHTNLQSPPPHTHQGSLNLPMWLQFPLDEGLRFNLEYLLVRHLSAGSGTRLVPQLRRELERGRALKASGPQHKPPSQQLAKVKGAGAMATLSRPFVISA